MAITVAEAAIRLVLDQASLKPALQEGERTVAQSADRIAQTLQQKLGSTLGASLFKGVQAGLDSLAKSATRAGTALSIGLSAPLLLIGGRLIKLAIDSVESENLFTVSMGRMADAARDWSKALSTSLGLNEFELRRTVAVFNNMLTSMGLGEQAAFDMSKALVELAADMASFFNISSAEAFQKLQAGISGEVEPLKRLGIVVNETTIKQFALSQGLIKQGQELSETGKIMARFGVIIQATKNVQGDLARTLDSPANKLRIMKEQANQAAVELGLALLPAFQALLADAKPLVTELSKLAKEFKNLDPHTRQLIVRFGLITIAIGPLLVGIGKIAGALSSLIKLGFGMGPVAKVIVSGFAAIATGAGAATANVTRLALAMKGLGIVSIPAAAAFIPFTNVAAARQRLLNIAQEDARFAGLAKGLLTAPEFDLGHANQIIRAWERIHQAKTQDAEVAKDATKANTDLQAALDKILKAGAAGAAAKGGAKGQGTNVALQRALQMFDLLVARDNLSTADQIKNLERIRDRYAKNTDERMDLDIRVARLKNQLADEEDARLDRPRRIAAARFDAEAQAIDDVLARLKEAADAGDVDTVIRLLDQWKLRLPDIAHGYIEIARQAREASDAALASAAATIARPGRVIEERTGPEGLIEAAQQRLEELGIARVRNIDLIQREISQLQIIVEQEAKREQQLLDEAQITEARRNGLQAERDIEERLLEIARLRVDDARANLDLMQLEQSLGLATAADVDAARRQALAALQAQLATAKALNATQAELIPILQDILFLQDDLIRGDMLASIRQAIAEVRAQTFDFLTGARQFFQDLQQGIAEALRGFATEGKTVLELLGNLARAVFNAIFTQITNFVAQQLTQRLAGLVGGLIPGLGAAGPDVGVAAAGASLGTAGLTLNTAGVGLSTAGIGLNAAALALQAAAVALTGAGAGSGLFAGLGSLLGLQHGGIVTAPMLAPLAEAGRPEMVLPLPRGLRAEDLANTMRAVAEGAGGATINIINPVVRNDEDIHRIGRSVADALRMARRGNHPLFRGGR